MTEKYRMFRRAGGNYYSRDRITRQSESLGTSDRATAIQLLAARNLAVAQPQLNRTMAKAYLSAKSPDLLTRRDGQQMSLSLVMQSFRMCGVVQIAQQIAFSFEEGRLHQIFVSSPFGRSEAGGAFSSHCL